ncbi:MAG: alpha/beta fold hydrolase [Syntrophomonadaceae bacterium]
MNPRRLVGAVAALSGAALSVFALRRYRRDLRFARERIAAGSRIVETAVGPIECAEAGEGPPVFVVHGAGGGFDQGMQLSRPLVDAGFRVVAPSRFGYLRTPLPSDSPGGPFRTGPEGASGAAFSRRDASAAAQADAHAALLDALSIERTAVVGVSAGAPSAMQLALRHPGRVSALVLLVPAAYPARVARTSRGGMPERLSRANALVLDAALRSDFLFWLLCRAAPRTTTRAILGTDPEVLAAASPEERARAERVVSNLLPISRRRLGLRNDAAVTGSLPRYELERIAAPTLVVSVEDDLYGTWEGARHSADHIPGARFIGYPSGGHLWVGHHRKLMGEVVAFLRGAT